MKKYLLLILIPLLPFWGYSQISNSKSARPGTFADSTIIIQLSAQDLQLLFQRQDSMIQLYLKNLESRLIERQKLSIDSSMERILNRINSDTSKFDKSIAQILALYKNDSATTQKLLDAFEEKSKTDAAFFRQISASGRILSSQDSIYIIQLDSAVSINLAETDHVLRILKQESTFLDTYINLSLFTLGLIGGNLLNGNENWGFYAAEVVGGLLAWRAISQKHKIDDDIDDIQQINDALDAIHKNIKYFRRQIVHYNYKYPAFLSEKIPLVEKKYELLNMSLQLSSIFDGAELKRGTKKYNLLLHSRNWFGMFTASTWYNLFGRQSREKMKHKKLSQ